MATMLDPVGPLGPGVYWRRRLVLLGVVLLVLLVLAKACTGGGGSSSSGSSTPGPVTTSPAADPSGTPKASSTPKASTSTEPVGTCKDSDVLVTATPSKPNYAVGDTVSITYVVATKNGVRCKRDVGGAADEVRVASGSSVIWSSDYCNPGGKPDVRTIGPGDAFSVIVEWDGDVTASGCPTDRLPAPAGNYQVLGRNGAVFGPSSPLTLG